MSHARIAFLAGVGSILDVGATMYRTRDYGCVDLGSLAQDRRAIWRDSQQAIAKTEREAAPVGDLLSHGTTQPV